VDALGDVVAAVGDLVTEYPIAELDLNPVLASPDGALALDALVVLEAEADSENPVTSEAETETGR
jgi:succinyl-CoA synthetase beta subunit